ncbi:MAG: hypothetical protein VB086_03670 [Clostridiaceae bacterium]|nr:hypothetical protein [Clostridiaceae bacterium]
MDAIVYTSNSGFTEKYARLLSDRTGLPVFSLGTGCPEKGAKVIYLGWLMAGSLKGFSQAARQWDVQAVCAVGMAPPSVRQEAETRKKCRLPDNVPVFVLQGGFNIHKLHGVYRLMMKIMAATAGRALEKKVNRTPEEQDMLDLLRDGGDRVTPEALNPVLTWLEGHR